MIGFSVLLIAFLTECGRSGELSFCKKINPQELESMFEEENCCLGDAGLRIDEHRLSLTLSKSAQLLQEDFTLEELLSAEMSNGYNFFHFLFSTRDSVVFDELFNKCFGDKSIPRAVLESHTEIEEFNILHLSILAENFEAALKALKKAENTTILDSEDAEGDTPFFLLCDKYINSISSKEKDDDLTKIFNCMLEFNFDLNHLNHAGRNFLGESISNIITCPCAEKVQDQKRKERILDLLAFFAKNCSEKRRETEILLSRCTQNLEAEMDQEFSKAIIQIATNMEMKEIGPKHEQTKNQVSKETSSSMRQPLIMEDRGSGVELTDIPFELSSQAMAGHSSEFIRSEILVKSAREAAGEEQQDTRALSTAPPSYRSSSSTREILEDYELLRVDEDEGEELVRKVLADQKLQDLIKLYSQIEVRNAKAASLSFLVMLDDNYESALSDSDGILCLIDVARQIIEGEVNKKLARLLRIENMETKFLLGRMAFIIFLKELVKTVHSDLLLELPKLEYKWQKEQAKLRAKMDKLVEEGKTLEEKDEEHHRMETTLQDEIEEISKPNGRSSWRGLVEHTKSCMSHYFDRALKESAFDDIQFRKVNNYVKKGFKRSQDAIVNKIELDGIAHFAASLFCVKPALLKKEEEKAKLTDLFMLRMFIELIEVSPEALDSFMGSAIRIPIGVEQLAAIGIDISESSIEDPERAISNASTLIPVQTAEVPFSMQQSITGRSKGDSAISTAAEEEDGRSQAGSESLAGPTWHFTGSNDAASIRSDSGIYSVGETRRTGRLKSLIEKAELYAEKYLQTQAVTEREKGKKKEESELTKLLFRELVDGKTAEQISNQLRAKNEWEKRTVCRFVRAKILLSLLNSEYKKTSKKLSNSLLVSAASVAAGAVGVQTSVPPLDVQRVKVVEKRLKDILKDGFDLGGKWAADSKALMDLFDDAPYIKDTSINKGKDFWKNEDTLSTTAASMGVYLQRHTDTDALVSLATLYLLAKTAWRDESYVVSAKVIEAFMSKVESNIALLPPREEDTVSAATEA